MRRILNTISHLIPDDVKRIGANSFEYLPSSLRYGRSYTQARSLLEASQYWSFVEHEAYQLEVIKKLTAHAYANVPFYRERFGALGIKPTDIRTLSDVSSLPIISKDDLRENLDRMRAENYRRSKFQYHTTGGSTGTPVGLYWEADRTVPIEYAFMHRQWSWVGYNPDVHKAAILRGIPLRGGRLYERLGPRKLRLSSYDLTDSNINEILSAISRFRPSAIQAYPSAIAIVADYILAHGSPDLSSIRVILCGSENLYSWQRERIQRAFNCRVYSWYGQSEYVALAGGCEHSDLYHFYSEYGITEFLRQDGTVAGPGEIGNIVATGFNNFAFPLIRYRTDDLARVAALKQCPCGRNYPLVETIEGRAQEMIVGKQGNLISMTAINMHNDVFDNVRQFQFLQEVAGAIILRIVRNAGYDDNDEAKIRKALDEKLRDHVDIAFQYVDRIEPTSRGKTTFLVQRLKLNTNA